MSQLLATLRQKRKTDSALFHRYRIGARHDTSSWHLFFEGHDDVVFYVEHIKRLLPQNNRIYIYICDGKKGVLDLESKITARDAVHRAMFFIDKDHDDFFTSGKLGPLVYRTHSYSIENQVCQEDAFRVIWREQIGLSTEQPEYKKAFAITNSAMKFFAREMRPLMAWSIRERQENQKVILSNTESILSKMFVWKHLVLNKKPGFGSTFMQFCCGHKRMRNRRQVEQLYQRMPLADAESWLRGKLQLWAFLEVCNRIWSAQNGKSISSRKKVRKSYHLTPDNIFSIVASKIPTPPALVSFVRGILRLCQQS